MDIRNPVVSLTKALESALEKDMPDIEIADKDGTLTPVRPSLGDFEVFLFPQMWSTTALGFDNTVAGQAFTAADTVVIMDCLERAAVYFNGDLAYKVKKVNQTFHEDLQYHSMVSTSKKERYEKKSI